MGKRLVSQSPRKKEGTALEVGIAEINGHEALLRRGEVRKYSEEYQAP